MLQSCAPNCFGLSALTHGTDRHPRRWYAGHNLKEAIIKKLLIATIFLLFYTSASAQDSPYPFSAVQALFAAMSAYDEPAMRATSAPDFHLLEVGEVWDMDKLVSAVTSGDGAATRRNYFAVIDARTTGDRAWVSYWNRAVFTVPGGKAQNVEWLESAVMSKHGDRWLIEMLHSTRLGANQLIPESADLQEYVP